MNETSPRETLLSAADSGGEGDEAMRPGSANRLTARATLADIAQAAGVTRMTVSNALNDRVGVSAEVRDRIQTIARELGYVTNWVAKKLSDSRSNTQSGIIGVIAEIHTPFMAEVVSSISAAVRDHGRDMLVYSLPDPGKDVPGNVLDLLLHAVDGVISVLPRDTNDLNTLIRAGVPIVAVDKLENETALSSVAADSYQGGCLAVRHLIELGHRRIAFLAGEDGRLSARDRLRAYRDTLLQAGIRVHEGYVVAGGYLQVPGQRATETLLAQATPPTAIFAANDASALGAIAAINAAGLSVPDDISVVGFDDVFAASQVNPGLTTIRQPFRKIGSMAVECLLSAKTRPEEWQAGPHDILLPVELIVRASTSAP
jgi:LacI family transcriptional regulator